MATRLTLVVSLVGLSAALSSCRADGGSSESSPSELRNQDPPVGQSEGGAVKNDAGTGVQGGDSNDPDASDSPPAVDPYESDVPIALAGTYSYGFEASGFQPCDSDESWWVTGGVGASGDDCLRLGCQFFISGKGIVGPPGRYGHAGAATREVRFTEIEEFQPIELSDDPADYCP